MTIALRLAVLSFCLVINVRAQELNKSSAPETNVAERVHLLESELERQNSKLDQLQKTLLEQQQTIQALLEKLSGQPVAAKEAETPVAIAAEPQQTSTTEQRLTKLEGEALKIGPVRVSGDFRVRFDGIFRSTTEPPDPPLEHVQQARARYRLRLNLDTDIHPNLSFHAQLSTGPLNNQLSSNQDFTSMTVRAPISLSEAWIEYRPKKSIQLQAGRVVDIFADNSKFLFDDDLRFNGFNERYTATFKPNGARVTSLEFRAGQYILSTPNIAVIQPNSPLARLGDVVGTSGRSAMIFHQGVLAN
ncbi:MAG TPA: putative porin, partial [Pyrinomonadaceae bacterium]